MMFHLYLLLMQLIYTVLFSLARLSCTILPEVLNILIGGYQCDLKVIVNTMWSCDTVLSIYVCTIGPRLLSNCPILNYQHIRVTTVSVL